MSSSSSTILPPFPMSYATSPYHTSTPSSSRPASLLSVSSLNPAPTPPPLLPLPPLPVGPSPINIDTLGFSLPRRSAGDRTSGGRWRNGGARSIRTLSCVIDGLDGAITENSDGERMSLAHEQNVPSVATELALPLLCSQPTLSPRLSPRTDKFVFTPQLLTPSSSSDYLQDSPIRTSSLPSLPSQLPSRPELGITTNLNVDADRGSFRKDSLPYSPLASPLLYNKELPLTPIDRDATLEFSHMGATGADVSLVDEVLIESSPEYAPRRPRISNGSARMLLSPPRSARNSHIESDLDLGEALMEVASSFPLSATATSGQKSAPSSPPRSKRASSIKPLKLSASMPASSVPSPPSSPDIAYILSATPRSAAATRRKSKSPPPARAPSSTPQMIRDRTVSQPTLSRSSTRGSSASGSTTHSAKTDNVRTVDPGCPPSSFNAFSFSTRTSKSRTRRGGSDASSNRLAAVSEPGSIPESRPISPRSRSAFDTSRRGPGIEEEQYDSAQESDDSLHIHTPLPELMVRAGLLSPASRIVKAQAAPAHSKADSLVSLGLGTPRAAHDTDKRIRRHRDGRMLRDGIGLTTGLGWSDSEDEDAPSPLRHRLSSILLSRMPTSSRHSLMTSRSGPLSRSTSSSTLSSGSATPYSPPMALAALGIGAAGIGLGIGIGGPPVKAVASNGSQVKLPRAHRPSLPLPVSTSAKVSQVRKAASHALLPTERPSFSSSVSAPPPPTLMNPKSKVVEDTSRSETPRARVPSGDSIRSPTLSASPLPTMRTRTTSNTSNASSAYSSHSLNADSSGLTSSDTSDASHNAPSIVHFSKTTPSSRSKLSSKNYNVPAPIVPPMTAMSLTFPAPPPLTPGARAAAAAKGKYIQRISPSRMPSSGISVGAN